MYAGRVCSCTQRTGTAVRESLQRDCPVGLTSPAFHTCGSASPFRARCCHSIQKLYTHHPILHSDWYRRVPKFSPYGSVCCACAEVTKKDIFQWVQNLGTLRYPDISVAETDWHYSKHARVYTKAYQCNVAGSTHTFPH